ncbi:gluconokinase [Diaphorobacter caeni]|uniref:gluconokinase n=1 Tax=Diaphorobacter caeni TaxID=2784387 RepID=UPI00188E14A8|nr:gluconokinase [Diaphorobacter caeni]MBF5006675.1 gluconokinase [Diaphorobacter caeni]
MQDSAIQTIGTPAIVVMGVSGCGKSSVAEACANALGWRLLEGDAYHPAANIEKMSAGIPLTDDDRAGWLDQLAALLAPQVGGQGVVLTCSALRRKYRDRLRVANSRMGFAFLDLSYDDALQRVEQRPGHFFSPALVANQFATLERPADESDVLTLNATLPIAELQTQVVAWAERMRWIQSSGRA